MRQVHGSAPGGTGIPPPASPGAAEAWWSRVRLRQNRAQRQPGGPGTTGLARCMGPDRGTARKRHPLPAGNGCLGSFILPPGPWLPQWPSAGPREGSPARHGVPWRGPLERRHGAEWGSTPRENSPLRCEFAAQKRRAGAAPPDSDCPQKAPAPCGDTGARGMIYSSARALASSMAFCWAAGGQSS